MVPLYVQRWVMDLAIEDYTPLWDVYGAIRQHMPDHDHEFYLRSARELVAVLRKRGFVRLYYYDWTKPTGKLRHVTELTPEEIQAECAKESNWIPEMQPTPYVFSVTIGATEQGEQAMCNWPGLN